MSGEFIEYDELLTTGAGAAYKFMLARPGTPTNVSSSPFAPKSVFGERSYADYDAISALALTDFAGGVGQERLTDTTQYYDGVDVDTRGGALILSGQDKSYGGALPVYPVTGEKWALISPAYLAVSTKIAQRYIVPADTTELRGVWLYNLWQEDLTSVNVSLYSNDPAEHPGDLLAAGDPNYLLKNHYIRSWGFWSYIPWTTPQAVTPNTVLWVVVENAVANTQLYWLYDETAAGEGTALYWNAAPPGWAGLDMHMALWMDGYTVRPAEPPLPFTGVGGDEIERVWVAAPPCLYYVNNNASTATPSGPWLTAVLATPGGAIKQIPAEIYSHAWYRAPADTGNWLYCALDDANDMQRFNGKIGDEVWETLTGHPARCLCVHDNLLVYSYDRNRVDCFDGTNWGDGAGTSYVEVGTRTYPVVNLVSWNGNVWAGKSDGLYKITVPAGYPVTGTLTCQKIIDLEPLAGFVNCWLMLVHLGDLWFSVGHGLMRYTTGGVLTSVAPDLALPVNATARRHFAAGVSALNALWLLAETNTDPGTLAWTDAAQPGNSALYCYVEGHWYATNEFVGATKQIMSGICIDPGWYGKHARLWFGQGWQLSYIEMPMFTLRRWLVPQLNYEITGYLLSSWFDGNIRTVEKDWMVCELIVSNSDQDAATTTDTVQVWWRPDERTAWASLLYEGAAVAFTDLGTVKLTFPAGSHSEKLQLKIVLTTNDASQLTTPRVEAVIVRYMERPDDVRAHTRAYRLADRLENRNGVLVTRSLAQQLADLRTLREAKEPLTWRAWYGTTYTAHIIDYSVSEMPVELRSTGDKGEMLAIVRLQEVEV